MISYSAPKPEPPLINGGSIVTTYHAMGSAKPNRKRKASDVEANATTTNGATTDAAAVAQPRDQDLDLDNFGDSSELGLIDMSGVLGDSDDDPSDLDYSTEDGDEQEDEESDFEDDIASEDIPTDDEAGEDKLALANGNNANGYDDEDEDDKPNYTIEKGADGSIRYVYDEIDPVYDSDDTDAQGPVNTVRHASSPPVPLLSQSASRYFFFEETWELYGIRKQYERIIGC